MTRILLDDLRAADNDNKTIGRPTHDSILVRLVTAGALLAAAAGAALAQAPKPWKHGIIAPKADAGFLLMAAKRGFAEKEGLKLELLEVKDDQIGLKALLSGELDSYEGGAQGAIAVNVRGGDVKIMGCHWVVVPHGIMVKAGIDKIEDLKGRAVAVSAPGSFPDMLARLALAKFKIATVTPPWSGAWSTPPWCRTNICRWRARKASRCCWRARTRCRISCASACSPAPRCSPSGARTPSVF